MMKNKWKEMLFVMTFALGVPSLVFSQIKPATVMPSGISEAVAETTALERDKQKIPVLMADGTVQEQELEAYITGVVLREMPAEFEPEALKAQAVVARTYALRRNTVGEKHEMGAVCTDPSCCQGFCSEKEYILNGGTEELLEKVRQAVEDTAGLVLTYEGELAEATYFSCSGGMTEDAAAVWGSDVPYLQSTSSPGEEMARHYTDTVTFTAKEFSQRLGEGLAGLPGGWVGEITYTKGGGVDTIVLGGRKFTGTELRRLLDLRSTAFVITVIGDAVTVTTKGFGHRVGMSQYGADAMAVEGSEYSQILSHYYRGTEVAPYGR